MQYRGYRRLVTQDIVDAKKQRLIVYRVKIRDAIPKSLFNQSLRLSKGRKINPIVENNKFENFL